MHRQGGRRGIVRDFYRLLQRIIHHWRQGLTLVPSSAQLELTLSAMGPMPVNVFRRCSS
jgi:hypothetical protein